MPTESSSSKSKWSLKSMLGRSKGGAKDKDAGKRHNKCTCKKSSSREEDEESAVETASIKERVLAKLKEPLPSELRQAARLSLDSLSFSPRLTARTSVSRHGRHIPAEDDYSAAGSQRSRNSTSSSYSYHGTPDTTNSTYQASVIKEAAYDMSRGHYWSPRSSCSSPVPSNVIARLMGLSTTDHHASSSQVHNFGADPAAAAGLTSSRPPTVHVHTPPPRTTANQRFGPRQSSSVNNSHSTRSVNSTSTSSRDCPGAQDFLDEMEDHLKQCDKALERIEAVMQLKKKLLYLNKVSSGSEKFSRNMDHRRDVYKYAHEQQLPMAMGNRNVKHVRTRSVDQLVSHATGYRRDDKERNTGRAAPEQKSYRHRRSVSDGETPVFRPAHPAQPAGQWHTAAYDIELDVASRDESARQWQAELENIKRKRRLHESQLRETFERHSSPPHTPNNIRPCHVDPEEHTPGAPDNSEQPSPVSVLDLTHHLSPHEDSTSEDDRDLLRDKDIEHQIIDPAKTKTSTTSTTAKKKSVVRALWTADKEAAAAAASDHHVQMLTVKGKAAAAEAEVDDAEVVRRMERSWGGGWRGEMAEVGVEVERLMFRRLLEETMIHVASCCRRAG